MSENLSDFLIDLASDPGHMARFGVDPSAELDASRLTVEERMAVTSGHSRAIREQLATSEPEERGGKAQPLSEEYAMAGTRNGGAARNGGGMRNGGGKRNGGGSRNGGRKPTRSRRSRVSKRKGPSKRKRGGKRR